MIEQNYPLVAMSLLTYAAILLSTPFQRKKIQKACGDCLLKLVSFPKLRSILILFFSPLLVCVLLFRDFGTFVNIIFALCGILAGYMGRKDLLLSKLDGVYQNCVISTSQKIDFDSIYAFPTLEYENDKDTEYVDFRVLKVKIKGENNERMLVFSSSDERNSCLYKILELKPELNSK